MMVTNIGLMTEFVFAVCKLQELFQSLKINKQKHVPRRVSELEKTLGAVYQEWRVVL